MIEINAVEICERKYNIQKNINNIIVIGEKSS